MSKRFVSHGIPEAKFVDESLSGNLPETGEEHLIPRARVLRRVESVITGEKVKKNGDPETSFQVIADGWNWYLKRKLAEDITDVDVAEMMAIFKTARMICGAASEDHPVDRIGYLAISYELGRQI